MDATLTTVADRIAAQVRKGADQFPRPKQPYFERPLATTSISNQRNHAIVALFDHLPIGGVITGLTQIALAMNVSPATAGKICRELAKRGVADYDPGRSSRIQKERRPAVLVMHYRDLVDAWEALGTSSTSFLTPAQKRVLEVLEEMGGEWTDGRKLWADKAGVSLPTLDRAIKALKKGRYIESMGRQAGSNHLTHGWKLTIHESDSFDSANPGETITTANSVCSPLPTDLQSDDVTATDYIQRSDSLASDPPSETITTLNSPDPCETPECRWKGLAHSVRCWIKEDFSCNTDGCLLKGSDHNGRHVQAIAPHA